MSLRPRLNTMPRSVPRPADRPRSAPGWLWVLVVAAVLTQTGVQLLRPVTSYQLLSFGYGETEIGATTAVYAILPLVLAMPLGRATSVIGDIRWIMICGTVLLGAGGAVLGSATELIGVFAGSVLLGVGHLMFTLAGQSVVSRRSSATVMDLGFGLFTAAFSAGQMLGPFLSGLILGSRAEASEITTALWVGSLLCFGAVPLLFGLRGSSSDQDSVARPRNEGDQRTQTGSLPISGTKPTALRILRVPGIASNMFAALAMLAMIDILVAFMPLVGESLGVSPLVIGALLSARGLASVISRVFLPIVTRHVYRNTVLIGAVGISGIAVALVPVVLNDTAVGIVAAGVLISIGGVFLGLGQPLTMTQISQAVPLNWRSPALALRLVGNRVGQVLIPLVAGLVATPWGPAGGIWCASALLLVSATERLGLRRWGPDPDERDRDN